MALQTKDFAVTGKSASGGITYTYILRVTENSISIPGNTSNVTVQAILKQSYAGTAFENWYTGVSCTLNGSQIFSDYKQRRLAGTGEHIYCTWTGDIAHGADGKLQLQVGGKLWQSSYADFSPPAMTISESAAGALALTDIPRASGISAKDAAITGVSRVTVRRLSAGLTHSIGWKFGSLSGYLTSDGASVSGEQIFSQTGLDFTLPESFYTQIPNAASGVCTLTCTTYSGTVAIGKSTCTFTARAAESLCAPVVSGAMRDSNPATVALTGDASVLVRGKSNALCTITAQARNGATVQKRMIAGAVLEGVNYTVNAIETGAVTFSATDSRGFTASTVVTLSTVPYVHLTCNASVKRTDPTSGNAVLTVKGKYYNGSFGKSNNRLTVQYTLSGETVTVTPTVGSDNTYTVTVSLSGLDYTAAYPITVTVVDALTRINRGLTLPRGEPVFDWSQEDFRFRVPVSGSFTGDFQGVRMATAALSGTNVLRLQSAYREFSAETGTGRQSIFLFGAANITPVYGLLTVYGRGEVTWSGTQGVTVKTATGGQVELTLPNSAWDAFTGLSADAFTFI